MKRVWLLMITVALLSILLIGCAGADIAPTVTMTERKETAAIETIEQTVSPTAQTEAATSPTKQETQAVTEAPAVPATESTSQPLLRIDANGYTFLADFEDNSSAEALREQLEAYDVTMEMRDYGGFEKVGELPFSLVTNDTQITTEPGDVILYQGDQLTIYYDTNTWSFTRIAKIRGADSSLRDKLGDGSVTVTLSLAYQ